MSKPTLIPSKCTCMGKLGSGPYCEICIQQIKDGGFFESTPNLITSETKETYK